jgi:hypothetical protein
MTFGRNQLREVAITPEFPDSDLPPLERCGELFEDFYTVTASVRRGIPVRVRLARTAEVQPAC